MPIGFTINSNEFNWQRQRIDQLTDKLLDMKWFIVLICFSIFASCKNHEKQIEDAVTSLEWVETELDEIGERNIKGYKQLLLIPGHEEVNPKDTIKLSVEEFRDIQTEIFSIRNDLEQLSEELQKERETE